MAHGASPYRVPARRVVPVAPAVSVAGPLRGAVVFLAIGALALLAACFADRSDLTPLLGLAVASALTGAHHALRAWTVRRALRPEPRRPAWEGVDGRTRLAL
ncbi:MAG: hypothetical protein ACFCGT_09615 [Sandaracinaceae bacterium]